MPTTVESWFLTLSLFLTSWYRELKVPLSPTLLYYPQFLKVSDFSDQIQICIFLRGSKLYYTYYNYYEKLIFSRPSGIFFSEFWYCCACLLIYCTSWSNILSLFICRNHLCYMAMSDQSLRSSITEMATCYFLLQKTQNQMCGTLWMVKDLEHITAMVVLSGALMLIVSLKNAFISQASG